MKTLDRLRSQFHRQRTTRARGELAEAEAVRWLRSRGYRILERNYRTKLGEIDVIALDGETLCFTEVKARGRTDYGPAALAVDRVRRRRLVRAATLYLGKSGGEDRACRFDVLAIERQRGEWRIRLYEGAFEAD